jgi:hypothetical protein
MNVSKRILCGLKWLNSLAALFTIWWMLWCLPSLPGLWLHYKLLRPGMRQSAVVNSLRDYYVMPAGYRFSRPLISNDYWALRRNWQPEGEPKLVIKQSFTREYDYLYLRFENGVLKEKFFCWD